MPIQIFALADDSNTSPYIYELTENPRNKLTSSDLTPIEDIDPEFDPDFDPGFDPDHSIEPFDPDSKKTYTWEEILNIFKSVKTICILLDDICYTCKIVEVKDIESIECTQVPYPSAKKFANLVDVASEVDKIISTRFESLTPIETIETIESNLPPENPPIETDPEPFIDYEAIFKKYLGYDPTDDITKHDMTKHFEQIGKYKHLRERYIDQSDFMKMVDKEILEKAELENTDLKIAEVENTEN